MVVVVSLMIIVMVMTLTLAIVMTFYEDCDVDDDITFSVRGAREGGREGASDSSNFHCHSRFSLPPMWPTLQCGAVLAFCPTLLNTYFSVSILCIVLQWSVLNIVAKASDCTTVDSAMLTRMQQTCSGHEHKQQRLESTLANSFNTLLIRVANFLSNVF